MATKVVCDICGEDATGTRVIDVCGAHTAAKPPRTGGPRVTRKCSVCGKRFDVRGIRQHEAAHARKS